MYYKITSLVALDDYILLLGFSNGEYKKFDLKPLMKKYPVFKDLETIPNLYKQVKIDIGGYGIVSKSLNTGYFFINGFKSNFLYSPFENPNNNI